MQDVVVHGQNRPPSRAILASPVLPEICGSEEGYPILSRPLSMATRDRLRSEIAEIETSLFSTLSDADVDRARAMLSASLAVKSDDAATVRMEEAAWALVLSNEEINGRIPPWAVERATIEFMSGEHGKFFPKIAEFVVVCKRIVAKARWAAIERRRILDAKVVPPQSAADDARRAEMVARLKTGPLFAAPAPIEREVTTTDDWEARRAEVMRQCDEMGGRAAE